MDLISAVFRAQIWLFLVGLALFVSYGLLIGRINVRGLVSDNATARGLSPVRVQLLLLTVAGAFAYARSVGQLLVGSAPADMPPIPDGLLIVVGGSNAAYLAGKTWTRLKRHLGHTGNRTNEREGSP